MFDKNWIDERLYSAISGRYVTAEMIEPFLLKLNDDFQLVEEGKSVENRVIKSVRWGVGKHKIFMWSQMHGNESTTTKAVLDLLHILNTCKEAWVDQLRNQVTLLIVPILNPDGAKAYTRVNANQVDLNRDSIDLTQPESRLLRLLFDQFNPYFAFNLHDQRTIFGVGDTGKSATISFLAPSYNEACEWNSTRIKAMQLIVEMNKAVQKVIPNHVGRFDDAYNINCIGDYFQTQNVPTILIEAGHYPKDYQREETRKIVLLSLLTALQAIEGNSYSNNQLEEYLTLPENEKNFADIIIKNVFFPSEVAFHVVKIQYLEVLEKENIIFYPIIVGFEEKESKFAHNTINNHLMFSNHIDSLNKCIGENMNDVIDFSSFE